MHDDGLDNDDEGISRVPSGSLLERVWDPQSQHDLQQAYVRLGAISALRNQIYFTWGRELDLSHALYPYPDGTGGDRIADSLLAACTAVEAATTRLHEYCLARGSQPAARRPPTTPSSHFDHAIPEPPAPAEAAPDAAQEEHLPERPRGA